MSIQLQTQKATNINKHFLDFDVKEAYNTYPKLKKLIKQNKKQLNKLLKKSKSKLNYENFVIPFCLNSHKIDLLVTPILHLNSVKNSKQTQKITSKCLEALSKYNTDILQNVYVFKVLKHIQYNEKSSLTLIQNVNLEKLLLAYKLNGCSLSKDKKAKIKDINIKLSKLSKNFSQNILNDTNKWSMKCSKADVEDIPKDILKNFKSKSKTKDGKDIYIFTLQAPSYMAYITYGNNRAKREQIYKAYCTRAPQNEDLIEDILNLKYKKAKLLGYQNYSTLALENRVAKNPKEVFKFLQKLKNLSVKKAKEQMQEIKKEAKKDGINIKNMQSYDVAYYSQKLLSKKHKFNENKYRKYFKSDNVLEGLFLLLDKLFGIKAKKIKCKTWDKEVKTYDIYTNNKLKARLYIDLQSRKNKQGGAWMNEWQSYYSYKNQKSLASAFVVCNFSSSSKNRPSLLTHNDVVTLFHEMGHAIHHIMSKTKEVELSGVNGVAWDVVEFPSQFLELFAYDKDVLSLFAKNYKNNKALSNKNMNKLIKNKNFNSSLAMLRQLEFGLFDMQIHNKGKINKNEVQNILDNIREQTSMLKPPRYNKFQNSFSHIFAGGYASGYYSYKYAEVLSADLFIEFKKNKIFSQKSKALAKRYKQEVLSKGSSEDMNKLFENVVKRKLDTKAILKINNIS